MRTKFLTYLATTFFMFSNLHAIVCDDFSEFKEFNGHYYTITTHRLSFKEAMEIAKNNKAYIAIPDNKAENDFLAKNYPNSWIGIYDPSMQENTCVGPNCGIFNPSRFKTVNGGNLTFSNWDNGEPNNYVDFGDVSKNYEAKVTPLGEHWVAIGRNSKWGDMGNHFLDRNNPIRFNAILEFDSKPECMKQENELVESQTNKCTESIKSNGTSNNLEVQNWNGDVPDSSLGQVHECLKDEFGTEYCPAQLAQCGDDWDYSSGYAIPQIGTQTDQIGKDPTHSYTKPSVAEQTCENHNVGCSGNHAFSWTESAGSMISRLLSKGPLQIYESGSYKGQINSYGDISKIHETCDGFGLSWNGGSAGCFGKQVGKFFVGKCNRGQAFSFCQTKNCELATYNMPDKIKGSVTAYYCKNSDVVSCPGGYTPTKLPNGHMSCQSTTYKCPDGYKDNGKGCEISYNYTYYKYVCESSYEGPIMQNTGSSAIPPANNCRRKKYVCLAAKDRPCVKLGDSWKCSPFPCLGADNLQDTDTLAGNNDSKNKGFEEDGSCVGQIRIFNGQDRRCTDKYTLEPTRHCCADKDGILGFLNKCSPDEKTLAKYLKKTKKSAHYVGSYCALKVLNICLRKKKTYCTFGSLLSKIINEQGKIQLGKSWGTPEEPDCKGFTPEEFQKVDMGAIDMSEFENDLTDKVGELLDNKTIQNIPNIIEDKLNLQYGKPKK